MSVTIDVSSDFGDMTFRSGRPISHLDPEKSKRQLERDIADAVLRVAKALDLNREAIERHLLR
jgi:hypothetical protein